MVGREGLEPRNASLALALAGGSLLRGRCPLIARALFRVHA